MKRHIGAQARVVAALLACAVVCGNVAGCASAAYVPRNPCTLNTVVVDGVPHYYLGGRVFRGGPFGGALPMATSGVEQAQRYAVESEVAGTSFLAMYLGGLSIMVASPLVMFTSDKPFGPTGLTFGQAGTIGLLAAGTALTAASIYQVTKMQARMYDAVNAYTERVTLARRGPPPRGGTLPGQRMFGPPAILPRPVTSDHRASDGR